VKTQETPVETRSGRRLDELDSLRGLAALLVVFFHLNNLWETPATRLAYFVRFWLLYPFTAGHEAVVLFFVLSGFVLAIPAIRGKGLTYPVFLLRRLFRIYFPYLVALALGVTGAAKFHNHIGLSAWYTDVWSKPVDWRLVWQHVVFIGQYHYYQFNIAFWSLAIEMRISLIFPLLCALALRLRPSHSLVLAAFISFAGSLFYYFHPSSEAIYSTLHFAPLFIVGIYLARQQRELSAFYASRSRIAKLAGALLSAFLFIFGLRNHVDHPLHLVTDWPTTLGAAGIIVFSLNSTVFRRVLLWPPIRFLGRISYSVYLLHCTVMLVLVHLLDGHLPRLVIVAVCFGSILVLSSIFYFLVEKPSMYWGRQVGDFMDGGAHSDLPQLTKE